ncbi:bifunctional hydroxymethylpyrimidine kinase/phosphomethylpyrimidine kinase [uncultured Olegusella sp.]|uniref:bifunctional hydroxymethylpyrimidine kinase/phosphomethylpyrimidine kinase n=1 Tax=uncultured Olegusella sp. TaxID=1979846 RepID=UPI0026040438|nr:bifunctional hydroxymethylpyrimidine kinase/phosphomethylpyrimidine kinase [uncultured Olegusella sp.]
MANANDLVLYQRSGNYIPRIAAVHDLCGYGKCSLGVAIPVLSAAGCDVCPVPTSLFSAHTGFPQFYMHDTTSMLKDYLDAWKIHGIDLDAVYSGFLGSAEQVAVIQRLYSEYPRALRIVDPVMGDAGEKYPTYTDEMCAATRGLVDGADLLVPNLTEASILTGINYEGQDVSRDYTSRLVDALLEMGAKNVVIKGAVRGDNKIYNYVCGRDFEGEELESELLPFMIHGTGDLYASSLLAAIMCNKSLRAAVAFAGQFVVDAMCMTRHQPGFELRGVSFESVLSEVTALVGPEFR